MSKIKKQEIGEKPRNTVKKTQEDVEDELLKLFPNYELKDKYINLRTPALFYCKKHNINFEGNLYSLLIQGKEQCPICCKKTKSCGELYIENWFNKNKIHFQSQVRFSNDIIVGKFENSGVIIDFCFEYNSKKYWIEYDGEQHYVWCKHLQSLEKFEGQLRRDSNVRVYCKNNNIILIEIPWKYNSQIKVDDILDKIIFKQEPTSIIIQPEINYQRVKRKEDQGYD